MRARMILACGALFLSTVAIGSAKSWDVTMTSAVKAGSMMLPAGSYHLKLDNTKAEATFTDTDSGKKFSAPVKVDQGSQKFSDTAVESQNTDGQEVIRFIDLGGTTQKLQFTQ
jgi:hypothetical protein